MGIIAASEGYYQNQVISTKVLCKMLYWWKELFLHSFILSSKPKGPSLECVKAVGFKGSTWKGMCTVRARRGEGRGEDAVTRCPLQSWRTCPELLAHAVRVCKHLLSWCLCHNNTYLIIVPSF